MNNEKFPTQDWYLIASTAKVTQDLVNEFIYLEWDEALSNSLWLIHTSSYSDPAKSTKGITDDIATILMNTFETKDNFYLKYAN
jgi:hypothetical protein